MFLLLVINAVGLMKFTNTHSYITRTKTDTRNMIFHSSQYECEYFSVTMLTKKWQHSMINNESFTMNVSCVFWQLSLSTATNARLLLSGILSFKQVTVIQLSLYAVTLKFAISVSRGSIFQNFKLNGNTFESLMLHRFWKLLIRSDKLLRIFCEYTLIAKVSQINRMRIKVALV